MGLALALDLGTRGVPCTLVERTDGQIAMPKMNVVNVRTSADGKQARVLPFLGGLLDRKGNRFLGRPVDVMQMPDGALLVSDEENGAIYRISYSK